MAKTHFKQYLSALFEKIELGKPTHYKRFLLGLAESGITPNEVEHIFQVVNIGKKRYRVTIKPSAYDDYRKLKLKAIGSDKTTSQKAVAAASGKSHSKSASGAMCILHTESHQLNPHCVILDQGIPRELPELKKKILLIENFELFLEYQAMMKFITENTSHAVDLKDYDVMFSQGSAILNKQYRPFLMGYQEVLCLFDIDYGGLVIFDGLRKVCSGAKFLVPKDVDKLIDEYGFEITKEEASKLKAMTGNSSLPKVVKTVAKTILLKGKKVEQEVYLL
ncbi:hypothetical protein [Vibrio sp. D431a]|uniref:hypothetical protein n=1 Tax=Vibrio sp. D431a TaxID=2837388 RepID=UPI0025540344|nr:hypothetical protein [Vibrio sp. D431a]MDK9790684.1 hypothetical protein [Vibrio sp. D431a]